MSRWSRDVTQEGIHPQPGPQRAHRVRDVKRGAAAWSNLKEQVELDAYRFRLMAHTVADVTGLQRYLKEVANWLAFIEERQLPCATIGDRDEALCTFMAFRCYHDDEHFSAGDYLMNGMSYLWPRDSYPEGWACLRGWKRVTVEVQGGPVGAESLAVMEHDLRSHDNKMAHTAADMLSVATDGYCRESDLLKLLREDVVLADAGEVVLLFGRSRRGEAAKTGREQGVRLDWPHSETIVRRRCEGLRPKDRVFGVSAAEYTSWWNWAAARVGVTRPPHSVRHTGAARDLAEGYRSLEQVRRRGRWVSDKSVARYGKTHAWVAATEEQPLQIREAGARLLAARKARPSRPRE